MKVLYLTPGCFDKGGISRYSRFQIEALRAHFGIENVRALSLLGPDRGSFETPFSVTFHAGGASTIAKMHFVVSAFRHAWEWKPEIVWCAHVNFSGFSKLLAGVSRALSLTNVYGREVWGKKRPDVSWGLRNIDKVISDCHFTARYIVDHQLHLSSEISVIWDCVDDKRFSPGPACPAVLRKYGVPDLASGFNILTLGRLRKDAEYKGYARLLEVFAKVSRDLPNARLIYGGSGDLTGSLRQQAEFLGVLNRVFTGSIHEDHLPHIYRNASVFSLVSDRGDGRGEGIPLTPLEAASCGVPILVGNHDGSQEAVVDLLNGFILDPFDIDAHANAIREIATVENTRRLMAKEARKRIESEFSFLVFKARHVALIESILAN